MFSDYVLLYFDERPRRAKGLFNVLRGRKTVSTLFAGLTYGCLNALDSWHGVPLETFLATTRQLVAAGLLLSPSAGYYQTTPAGRSRQAVIHDQLYQPQAFVTYQTVNVRRFAQLSRLAVQVVSEAVHRERRYYPVTTDPSVQAAVKGWFYHHRGPDLGSAVYDGLTAFLKTLPDELATIFALGLSGHQMPGQTDQQLAQTFKRQPVETLVLKKDLVCRWCQWLISHPDDPFYDLLAPLVKASPVSSSAEQTYQDYLQTGDLVAIAQRRRLKLSTVREHLLEAAILRPDFDFERLLTPDTVAILQRAYADQPDLTTWQFATVLAIAPQLDFFYFRLYQIMRWQRAKR